MEKKSVYNTTILLTIIIIVAGILIVVGIKAGKEYRKYNNLMTKEKYLKLVLTNNKYSGYLTIKSHYEKKLMSYAIKYHDKFALALAKKEKAEIEYYKAGAK